MKHLFAFFLLVSAAAHADVEIDVDLSGLSHHFGKPSSYDQGNRWDQRNYGAGVESRSTQADSRWEQRWMLEEMTDSYGAKGGYAGYGLLYRVLDTPTWVGSAGVLGVVANRTFEFYGPHRWVALPLPVASLQHRPSGVGVNATVIPGVLGGVWVAFVQLTVKVK